MKLKTAFALLVATMAIDSRFDVVASSPSSSSILDGSSDPQATRKTRRVLNEKNKNTCQQEQTMIAGLKEDIDGHLITIAAYTSGDYIPIPKTRLKCFGSGYDDCLDAYIRDDGTWVINDPSSYGPRDPACANFPETCQQICEDCAGGPIFFTSSCSSDGVNTCKPGPAGCTGLHRDPFSKGYNTPCCEGLHRVIQPWDGPDKKWRYQCEKKETSLERVAAWNLIPKTKLKCYGSGYDDCLNGSINPNTGNWHFNVGNIMGYPCPDCANVPDLETFCDDCAGGALSSGENEYFCSPGTLEGPIPETELKCFGSAYVKCLNPYIRYDGTWALSDPSPYGPPDPECANFPESCEKLCNECAGGRAYTTGSCSSDGSNFCKPWPGPAGCTGLHRDPFSEGYNTPCCEDLRRVEKQWDGPGSKFRYQCEACTGLHRDPFSKGYNTPCCEGLHQVNKQWDGPGSKFRYQCEKKDTYD